METKTPNNIKVIHFNKNLKIEKDLTEDSRDRNYIYQITYKETSYVLKGNLIQLEHLDSGNKESAKLFKQSLVQVSEVFKNYHFAKIAGFFNTHIAQPLSLDYEIELAETKDSHSRMHIQVLFEYCGTTLDNLMPVNVELGYNLMRQSANALVLFHNLGVAHFDIKPSSMVYNDSKDLLQFINMGNIFEYNKLKSAKEDFEGKIFTEAFAPPEILKIAKDLGISPSLELSPSAVDVYCWGMSFYSLLCNKRAEELESDYKKYKLASGEDYTVFVKLSENKFNSVKIKDATEKSMLENIKSLLTDALNYKPKERPEMKNIIRSMKEYERAKRVRLRYSETELNDNKHLMNLLTCNDNEIQRRDSIFANRLEESKGDGSVELKCGHGVSKDYLVSYAIRLFLKKQMYNYSCFCPICYEVERLKRLLLDCGCTWTSFGTKVRFNESDLGKCDEDKPRTPIDLCLINDFISFKFTALMFSDLPEERRTSVLMDWFVEGFRKEHITDIVWILKSTKLVTQLDLTGNKIGDEGAKALAEVLKTKVVLNEINLGKNNIGNEGAKGIGEALAVNTTLACLDLRDNRVGNEGIKAISRALKVNKTLIQLDMRSNKVGCEGITAISEVLKTNNKLEKLNLSGNKVGVEGAKAISELLKINTTLTKLGLLETNLGVEGITIITEGLKFNKTISILEIGSNKIGDEGTKTIAGLLKTNNEITQLNLWNDNIGVEGAKYISEALKVNNILIQLEMNGNKIGAEGVRFISEALKSNKRLIKLSLTENKIGVQGVKYIVEVLKINTTLKRLELHGNNIGDEGVLVLCEVLRSNTSLTHLNLRNNNIEPEGARLIGEMLKVNRSLLQLELSNNNIQDTGTRSISESLKINNTVTHLHLRSNNIGYAGVMHIGGMLNSNNTLSVLDLHINNMGDEGVKCVAEALKTNEVLTYLDLRANNIGVEGANAIGKALKINRTLTALDLRGNKIVVEGREALRKIAERNKKVKITFY